MSTANPQRIVLSGYRLVRSFANPAIRASLQPSGLSDKEIERGNVLVHHAQESRFSAHRVKLSPVVRQVLDWGSTQFPVMHAVLADVAPDVEEHVFEGVALTHSSSDLYYVELVCGRVLALETSEIEAEIAASNALHEHGVLHDDVVGMLARCVEQSHFETVSTEAVAARDAALLALHGYHKKWSRIARARIKDRSLLRMMGVGRPRSSAEGEPPAPPAPAPAAEPKKDG